MKNINTPEQITDGSDDLTILNFLIAHVRGLSPVSASTPFDYDETPAE